MNDETHISDAVPIDQELIDVNRLLTVKTSETTYKAALVNIETGFVENVIIVDSFDELVPNGYIILPMSIIEITEGSSNEHLELIKILKEIDPEFRLPTREVSIEINKTKWSAERGFYLEEK